MNAASAISIIDIYYETSFSLVNFHIKQNNLNLTVNDNVIGEK